MSARNYLRRAFSSVSDPSTLYDVLVIGGGHAGTEAAAAAARIGARVALVTHKRNTIGALSCNPSIGGIGKGHLVRELDALHGVMPLAADAASIQFRTLNSSRGAAVRGPRAQVDRRLYRDAVNDILTSPLHNSLSIIEASATSFLLHKPISLPDDTNPTSPVVAGVRVDLPNGQSAELRAGAVVLTTGTFLNGRLLAGSTATPGGRLGDTPSISIADALRSHGLRLGRMKTGTPPRLLRASIDFTGLAEEKSDPHPMYFSFLTPDILAEHKQHTQSLISCHRTRTTPETHTLVRNAVANGQSPADMCPNGPRYCPSLEAKVSRFGDRDGHVVWLEPEALNSPLVYPAGISMSLPPDVQQRVVNTIGGLQHARIAIPGYAVEYDYVDPRELRPNLEVRRLGRLFLAGQINGTTGYEEAAAQGIIAGVNAAYCTSSPITRSNTPENTVDANTPSPNETIPPQFSDGYLRLGRGDAYIGVLLDDLTRLGTMEPYRMLTSRAEWRISLRADSADARLTPIGRHVGCVPRERWAFFQRKEAVIRQTTHTLQTFRLPRRQWEANGLRNIFANWRSKDNVTLSAWQILSRPEADIQAVCAAVARGGGVAVPGKEDEVMRQVEVLRRVEADCKYADAVRRQRVEVERRRRDEGLRVGGDFDYRGVDGLSTEDVEKLSAERPRSLGEAGRISGVSKAGIELVRVHLRRRRRRVE